MEKEKHVDEGWKQSVEDEKQKQNGEDKDVTGTETPSDKEDINQEQQESIEINFLTYVTSLAFQAMIFLGEIPNPVNDNKIDVNLRQAKFLIDTLILIRDKTKGNLEQQEDELLKTSIYELELKYVSRLNSSSEVKS